MPETRTHNKEEIGFVEQVKHYLVHLRGLPSVRVNDLLVDDQGRRALVNAVYEDKIEALMLDRTTMRPGVRMWPARNAAAISLGDHLFGAVLDGLGNVMSRPGGGPKEGLEDAAIQKPLAFDVKARGIDARSFIDNQLYTGFSAVDLLIPIGKGQRELVFGPRDSGKVRFLEEVILSQKNKDTVCIYGAIGKPASFTSRLVSVLERGGALDHTIIVSALSTNAAPTISVAPSTAFLIAEHFAEQGRDVVLVLDDLGVHAEYLREIALLAGRVPGRESYPGDIFYRHAHLMERAGQFNEKGGFGSITLFPVMETNRENATNLIPTNLMASTDGHLMFSVDQQTEGIMPAVSITESVTRIGHHTQTSLQRELSTQLMNIISEYPRQQEYSRFGTTLSERTKKILTQGELVFVLLNQEWVGALEMPIQIMLCSLVLTSLVEDEAVPQQARVYRNDILEILREAREFEEARERSMSDMSLDDFIEIMEQGLPSLQALW